MISNASLGAIFTLLSVGIPHTANAFEMLVTDDGTPLSRTSSTTQFFVQDILSAPNAKAVRSAIDRWDQRIGKVMPIRYAGQNSMVELQDLSQIFVLPSWSSEYGALEETVAHTRLVYHPDSGVISQSDILLNGQAFQFGEAEADYHTESVVLHELGHALGFAHSCGEPGRTYPSCFQVSDLEVLEAVMAPTLPIGTERLQFSLDDLEGMRSVYGSVVDQYQPLQPISIERDCIRRIWLAHFEFPENPIKIGARSLDGDYTVLQFAIVQGNRIEIEIPDAWQDESIDLRFEWPDPSTNSVAYNLSTEKPASCMDSMSSTVTSSGDESPELSGDSCSCQATSIKNSSLFGFFCVLFFFILRSVRWGYVNLVVVCGLAMTMFPADANAFRCTRVGNTVGPSLIWLERDIDWYLGEKVTQDLGDDARVVSIVKSSFDAWQNETCSDLSFSFQGQKPNLEARFNQEGVNENVVVFIEQGWIHQPGVVALTLNAFDRGSGIILDTDIEVNDQFFVWGDAEQVCSVEMDLENALVHEIGHFIGLSHPPNTPEFEDTTMFASAEPCEVKKRSLEMDDVEGLCSIYPKGQPNQQCFPPEGPGFVQIEKDLGYGCQNIKSHESWILVFLFLGLLRKRRVT